MKLLDLFCGAGGCTRGYQMAGFTVRGVDIKPQPRYVGDEFIQADALEYLQELIDSGEVKEFDAIHASPQCQAYSDMTNCRPAASAEHPRLIDDTRCAVSMSDLPWIIENVEGAPLADSSDLFGNHGVMLCGRMFNLDLYRHRVFETSFPVRQPAHIPHAIRASKAGHWEPGTVISVCGNCAPVAVSRAAMAIDWTNRNELAQAIPPAYTEYIGRQLVAAIGAVAA